MRLRRAFCILPPALALLTAACGDDAVPQAPGSDLMPGDELRFELFPNTKELSAASLAQVGEVAPDGRIAFAGEPVQLADVKRGSVIIAGASAKTPSGLLRFVYEVERIDGQLVLSTVNAPPELAFRNLHARLTRKLVTDQPGTPVDNRPLVLRPLDVGGAFSTTPLDYFVFNSDGKPATKHDQVHVTGSLGAGFDFYFGLDVDWGDVLDLPSAVVDCVVDAITGEGCSLKSLLPEVKVGYDVSAEANAKLAIEGVAFHGFERDYTLAKIPISPKVITFGPLVFVLGADVIGRVEGAASSEFSLSTGADFKAKSSIQFSSKTGGTFEPWVFERGFEQPAVAAGLTASAKVSVGPKLSIKLFDFVGPYMGVLGYAKLDADALREPCYSAKVGLDGELGFEIGIDLPVLGKVTLADFSTRDKLVETEVATGACAVPPGSSSLPPGKGADFEHLQNPTYTPWSRTYPNYIADFSDMPISYSWTDLTRAIDGSYVVGGSRAHALVKLDESGTLVWAKQFIDPEPLFNDDKPLRTGRVAPSNDAEMFVTAYPWTLLKVGQSGGLRWAKRLETGPHDRADHAAHGIAEENNQIGGAIEDGSGGVFLVSSDQPAASVPPQTRGWLTRVSRDGAILMSKSLVVAERQVYPLAVAPADGGLFVTGVLYDGVARVEEGFALRLGANGSVRWAKRLIGCSDLTPTAVVRTREDKYMIVGKASVYQRSFALIVGGADGAFLSSANPWTGSILDYAIIRSIVELPTSGFAVAGDYQTGEQAARGIFTAGLDSIGIPLWSQGYLWDRDAGFPALINTDAGGLFVAGELKEKDGIGETALWALTPFARDGAMTFPAASIAQLDSRPIANGDCVVGVQPLEVVVGDLPVTVTDRPVAVRDLATTAVVQSP